MFENAPTNFLGLPFLRASQAGLQGAARLGHSPASLGYRGLRDSGIAQPPSATGGATVGLSRSYLATTRLPFRAPFRLPRLGYALALQPPSASIGWAMPSHCSPLSPPSAGLCPRTAAPFAPPVRCARFTYV